MRIDFDDYELRYLAWIKSTDPFKSILARLARPLYGFNADDLQDAAHMMTAAATVFLDDENQFHPDTVTRFLLHITSDYSCWLDSLEDADRRFSAFCARIRARGNRSI